MLFGKLLPSEGNFFELFNEHGGRIVEAAQAFSLMIQHYADPELRQKYAAAVDTAERQADKVTAEVSRLLHKTFITPIDRDQIHSLYDVRRMTEEVVRLADLAVKCCERVSHAVSLLPRIRHGDVVAAAMKTCDEIDKLESDADRAMREAMSKLFREEPDVREVIKLKAIYEHLEAITDRCEDVANLIEGVVLEHS